MSLNGPKFPAKPVVDCSKDEIRVVQADAAEADINKIIARFEKAGMISSLNKSEPYYGDVSEFDGLQDAYMKVQNANDLFMGMSAIIREKFENDPIKMIDFLSDDNNRKEAEELGMVVPRARVPEVPDPVVPEPDVVASRDVDAPPYSKKVK